MQDDELIIEIPADEITLGHDADGLPKTVSTEKPPPEPKIEAKIEAKREPEIDPVDLEIARQEKADAEARATALQKERDSERELRLAAQKDATKSTEFGWRAHWAKVNADHDSIKGAIGSTRQALDSAKAAAAAAAEAGEHRQAADLHEQIATHAAYLTRLEEGRAGAEAEIERAKRGYQEYTEAAREPEPKKDEPEPRKKLTADDFIANAPVATQGWLKQHKTFAVPGSKEQRKLDIFAARWLLDHDDDRASLNTAAFVKAMDAEFFPKQTEETEIEMVEEEPVVEPPKPAPKPKAKAISAAPVSRSGNYFSSANPNAQQVRLPPKLAAFVKSSGLDPTQYALGAVADIKAGKLPKDFLDPDYDHNF